MCIKPIHFLVLILNLCFISLGLKAQINDTLNDASLVQKIDLSFVDFLINNQEHEDALLLLKQQLKRKNIDIIQLDSIHFYTAWAFYNLKNLDSSIVYFEKIEYNSAFYLQSKFYENFDNIYVNHLVDRTDRLEILNKQFDYLESKYELFQNSLPIWI
jgi:tetratricopeptide (TPR) repeat protein